ncbi:hypothetical protein [Pseudonocardia sp. D17]|uniref:hypothetical protein n=1 Tax=Pseudonocardia sp. D17 TaxID=882661 RepID=UPI002B3FCBD9|nr:hypothetical protein PSD17_66510 [Pseudonocardia sp. D17]
MRVIDRRAEEARRARVRTILVWIAVFIGAVSVVVALGLVMLDRAEAYSPSYQSPTVDQPPGWSLDRFRENPCQT